MQTSASVQPSDLFNCIARHPQAFPNRSPSKTLRQYLQSFLGPGVVLYFLRLAGWCGIHKGEDHIFIRAYLVAINKRNHNIHRCWTRCAVHGQVLQELLFCVLKDLLSNILHLHLNNLWIYKCIYLFISAPLEFHTISPLNVQRWPFPYLFHPSLQVTNPPHLTWVGRKRPAFFCARRRVGSPACPKQATDAGPGEAAKCLKIRRELDISFQVIHDIGKETCVFRLHLTS